jgi:hypothetical protein
MEKDGERGGGGVEGGNTLSLGGASTSAISIHLSALPPPQRSVQRMHVYVDESAAPRSSCSFFISSYASQPHTRARI